jgi:CubicO group peptidase (beta-lactamase class C family)
MNVLGVELLFPPAKRSAGDGQLILKRARRKTVSCAALVICCLLVGERVSRAQPAQVPGPIDPRELEAFLDRFFGEQMEELHIPGAVFVLVKDGDIFFSKGYGYADLTRKIAVNPDKTIFRVGSVSKLFTATAVMQLKEKGLLDLNDDVNKHLTLFQIPNAFGRPVTVANLLTHTGGFDERSIGIAARTASETEPLGRYLAARMPPRVLPPGDTISYSNHGMALAGYLVEAISGVPFAQYIAANITGPLGMSHSGFLLPPHLASDVAVDYAYQGDTFAPYAFDYHNDAPAGGMNTTGTDIARFMIAHLQNGRYKDARILNEATAQEMHRQQFTQHPRLPGYAFGFHEHFENNLRAIGHAGSWAGSGSLMFLLPEHHVGFFVSANRLEHDLDQQLVRQFLDRYYPSERRSVAAPARDSYSLERFAGSYRSNRYARHSLQKLMTLGGALRVTANDEGTLTVHYPTAYFEKESRWTPIEPLLFDRLDEDGSLAFRQDERGRITHLFLSTGAPGVFEKLPWYESTRFQLSVMAVFALTFASETLVWLSGSLFRRWRNRSSTAGRLSRHVRALTGLTSALNLLFLGGLAASLLLVDPFVFAYGMPRAVTIELLIPLLTTGLTVILLVLSWPVWKDPSWGLFGRLHHSLAVLAGVGFVPFLRYWNLLGFHF